MRAVGIAAECNPFHKGHRYLLEEARRRSGADAVVLVMSGDFVQRGEPALWDKWTRAAMAAENGADLVLELPFAYACNHGEAFAEGALGVLEGLGAVSALCFGSESGDLAALEEMSLLLEEEPPAFQTALRAALDRGASFPAAREEAAAAVLGAEKAALLRRPNEILALEYLKQLRRLGRFAELIAVRRVDLPKASALRQKYLKSKELQSLSDDLPPESTAVLQKIDHSVHMELNKLTPFLFWQMQREGERMADAPSAGEGLEMRLRKALRRPDCGNAEQLIALANSKRYPDSRLRRLLIQFLLGLDRAGWEELRARRLFYARVLALSERGAALLRACRKEERARIPIISNLSKELRDAEPVLPLLRFDVLASSLWHLAAGESPYHRSDYVMAPYFRKGEQAHGTSL